MKCLLSQGPMLTKTKNILLKIHFFFQKLKIWPRGRKNQNLKEIHGIGMSQLSQMDDGRTMDEFRLHELHVIT